MALKMLFYFLLVANFAHIYYAETGPDKNLEFRVAAIERQCAAQNAKLNTEIDQLKETVQKQDRKFARLNDEMYALKQFASQTLQQIGQTKDKRFVANEEGNVAFHATLTGRRTINHFHINQTISFDTVMLNIGGAYHSHQGLFLATIPGIYIFSVSIMGVYGGTDSPMVFILKNGKELAAAIADGRRDNHDQGSTTIVTQLVAGDEVWVSVQRHEDITIWTDGLDSFMGCLIART